MKGIVLKGRKSYWLAAIIIIAIVSTCLFIFQPFNTSSHLDGTQEEKEYDALQIKAKWQQILEKSQQQPPYSLACQKVVRLAQYRMKMAGKEAIYDCLSDSRQVLTSPTAAMMMSDLYLQLGMTNMAQRAAFEAMVKTHDAKDNGRALRRLTETAIITGQYDLALKYISLLENYRTHRKWAREMRKIAEHPELLHQKPTYQNLKKIYEKSEDMFFL